MTSDGPVVSPGADFQQDVAAAAKRYADAHGEALSAQLQRQAESFALQLQRAFLEGAMTAIRLEWTARALDAANVAANDAHQ